MLMFLTDFAREVHTLHQDVKTLSGKKIDLRVKPSPSGVFDYERARIETLQRSIPRHIKTLSEKSEKLKMEITGRGLSQVLQLVNELELYSGGNDMKNLMASTEKLASLVAEIQDNQETLRVFKVPEHIPAEIKEEVLADIHELNKCMEHQCYRSAVILCGRILETALHRKYFESAGKDLLETSPGIGLGKLVAKLSEKNIALDPGLSEQIHLINQVRISSVHTKQSAFSPNDAQARAIALFTSDVLEKLFVK